MHFVLKRILLLLLALTACGFLVRATLRALASQETRITWRIESMLDGFNKTRGKPVMRGIATEYVDHSTGYRRAEVHQALVSVFFRELEPETKKFALRAELVPGSLEIEINETEPASADVRLTISIRNDSRDQDWWLARIQGTMRELDGDWQWISTRQVNHGDRPARYR